MKTTVRFILAIAMLVALDFTASQAATMNDYCVVPPFIQQIAKPNLLMVLDNSASMNDLAYDDRGYNRCSATTAQSCAVNTDCPAGETCTQTRNPYYCFDETYSSAKSYVGYFDAAKNYQYNFSTSRFQEYAGTIPATCAMSADADNVYCKLISNTLHLNISKIDPTQTKYFYASGKYLNWLTSSKFDVEKQVLTGGKYVTGVCSNNAQISCLNSADCGGSACNSVSAFLQPESRGCVGMGYIKDVNTSNFVNYATGNLNPNTSLGLTFLVRGPANPYNAVAPSTGGQTYLEIFSKAGTTYDYEKCQKAIESIATGGNADIKQDVSACLDSSGAPSGICQRNSAISCTDNTACVFPAVSAHCSSDATRACTVDADCTILSGKTCSTGNIGVSCAANTDCDVKACTGNTARSCSVNSDCVKTTAVRGTCSNKKSTMCSSNADCKIKNFGVGTCVGAVAAFNDGTCGVKTPGTCTAVAGSVNSGPCIPASGGDLGPCLTTAATALNDTKVDFMQNMQACWSYRRGTPIGGDDILTVIKRCPTMYANIKTCSGEGYKLCSTNADCSSNNCLSGPAAIQPGNPGLLCATEYEGQFFELSGSSWVLKSGYDKNSPEMLAAHTQFCNDMDTPVVTDPTNPPTTVTTTENLPAILSGLSVAAQLGAPVLSIPVRIETASPPSGLVQEYANKIRIGLMAFNSYGSATEITGTTPLMKATKVCSNDPTRVCTQNIDCGLGNSCNNAADADGAKVLSLIGKGHCSNDASIACTKKAHCTAAGATCVSDGLGNHTTPGTLVSSIDNLRAASWTPFAEAFYNAIGYFALKTSDTTGKSSRSDVLRLNSADYPDDMNPSEYVCQANNILLVTDGSSTADLNSSKNALVNVYKAVSGNVTGACSKYAGSKDLDDLSWVAKHRNINTFSTATASTNLPLKGNEQINTYVVFNGSDNGETGDCNNTTLLTKTADNGGTALLKTEIPEQYQATLRKAFEQVAGGTASGTAASILSNSEGSGANILQAVFYPSKEFESETVSGVTNPTRATWIGEMQNLWYYVDPYIGNSTVRENTVDAASALDLDVKNDYVTEFQFKGGETIAVLKKDTNGDGSGDTIVTSATDSRVKSQGYCTNTTAPATSTYAKCVSDAGCSGETCIVQGVVNADDVKSLWRAGKQLWNRDLSSSPRKLYTYLYGSTAGACGASAFSVAGMYDLAAINWTTIDSNDKCIIRSLLQASSDAEAQNIIKFAQGYDHSDYDSSTGHITGTIDGNKPRNRSVKIGGSKKVWKLGDIISSTPRIQSFNKLNNYHLDSPAGYGDMTYADDTTVTGFANSTAYKARGMAYAGANDGMLHAFELGSLNTTASGTTKATLTGTGLGEEQWSFIPKNVLPYLKYLADPAYSHLYLVDGPTRLIDASIGHNDNSYINNTLRAKYSSAGCNGTGEGSAHTAYWACKRDQATSSNKSWRSIIIGSMGIGGASAEFGDTTCTDCVKNPVAGAGRSSYYAIDITNPASPQYLWEFTDTDLGYATTGVAVARINHKFTDSGVTYKDTNGRWFAVIGNGPTGPIDTTYHQFKGKSDKPLRVFVLDLKDGTLLKKIDTTINNAFAGSIASAPIDTDRSNKLSDGFYSDDALYFGYTACTANCGTDTPTWNGGVMRLLTDENINPDNWSLSTLISNTGPVSTAIGKLQDRKNKNLWLYTGSGRYFFKGDDSANAGKILAVREPCYSTVKNDIFSISEINGQSPKCTTEITFSSSDFADQTSAINSMVDNLGVSKKGWFIGMDGEDTVNNFGAERIITEPVALPNGAVFFTSFMPSSDICNYGGNSFLWGMRYDTGGAASASQLQGKALVQVSTGAFEEVSLSTALTDNLGRKMGTPMIGKPPTDPPPIVSSSGNKALKRILHIQEK